MANLSDADGDLKFASWFVNQWVAPIRFSVSSPTQSTYRYSFTVPFAGKFKVWALAFDSQGNQSLTRWEVIATDSPIDIGPQNTYEGSLSGPDDLKLFEVFVREGRDLRIALDGPSSANFDLFARPQDSPYPTWSYSSKNSSSSESIRVNPTRVGWYEILVDSDRGFGDFTLATRTDKVILDIVFSNSALRQTQSTISVETSKDCTFLDSLPLTEPARAIASHTATSRISIDLTDFAIRNPECYLDNQSDKGWRVKIQGVQGYRLEEVTIRLVFDDFEWVLSALEIPEGPLGDEVTIWVPLEDADKLFQAAKFVLDFVIFDDVNTLRSPEASFAAKAMALGFIALNFVPPAKLPALVGKAGIAGVKVAVKYGKPAVKSVDDVASLGQIDNAIKRADDPSFRNTIITSKAVLNLHSRILKMSRNIAGMSPKRMDGFLRKLDGAGKPVESEFDKVNNFVIKHTDGEKYNAEQYWVLIMDDLAIGKTLNANQVGFYMELRVAAAAKSIGMKLPDNWLRRSFGKSGKQATDVDVLAQEGDLLVAFDVKNDWFNYAKATNIDDIIKQIDRFAQAADEAGAQLAVAIGKGIPDSTVLLRMFHHGIEYVEWVE